jgi:hypothetical protein
MKRLIAAVVLGMVVAALPAFAADDAGKAPPAKPVASAKSLDPAKGAFHRTHTQKLKMACDGCHAPELKDALFLRGAEVSTSGPGPVDRGICLGCHQAPAKPTWYGAAAK